MPTTSPRRHAPTPPGPTSSASIAPGARPTWRPAIAWKYWGRATRTPNRPNTPGSSRRRPGHPAQDPDHRHRGPRAARCRPLNSLEPDLESLVAGWDPAAGRAARPGLALGAVAADVDWPAQGSDPAAARSLRAGLGHGSPNFCRHRLTVRQLDADHNPTHGSRRQRQR